MFQDTVVTKAVTVSSLSSRSLSRLNTQGSVQLHLVSQHGRSSQVPCFTFAVPLLGTLSPSSSAIKVMLTQYNYFSLCETFPRLSQIPNLQNYELPSFRFQNILYVPYDDDSNYSASLFSHLLAD